MAFHTLAGHAHLVLVAVRTLAADGTISIPIRVLAEQARHADTVDALLQLGANGRKVFAGQPNHELDGGV